MKTILFSALALLFSFVTVAQADDRKGLACGYGVAGFNGSDPEMLLGVIRLEIPFQAGSETVASTGRGYKDLEEQTEGDVQVTSLKPAAEELYSLDLLDWDNVKMKVSVSKRPFSGRYGGLSPELAKQGVDSTATLEFPDSKLELRGICFVQK